MIVSGLHVNEEENGGQLDTFAHFTFSSSTLGRLCFKEPDQTWPLFGKEENPLLNASSWRERKAVLGPRFEIGLRLSISLSLSLLCGEN